MGECESETKTRDTRDEWSDPSMAMKGRTGYPLLSPLTVIWGNIHGVSSLSTEVAHKQWRCKGFPPSTA